MCMICVCINMFMYAWYLSHVELAACSNHVSLLPVCLTLFLQLCYPTIPALAGWPTCWFGPIRSWRHLETPRPIGMIIPVGLASTWILTLTSRETLPEATSRTTSWKRCGVGRHEEEEREKEEEEGREGEWRRRGCMITWYNCWVCPQLLIVQNMI